MHHFFSEDNPVFAFLSYAADLVIVSLLWLVCSLPVVTAGAAASALYYAVTKSLRHKRGYVTREFFRGLKMCFKQGTAIWLIYVLLMGVLMLDISIVRASGFQGAAFLQVVFAVIMLSLTGLMVYAIAYIARFTLPLKNVFGNVLLIALRHLPRTLLVVLVSVCAAAAIRLMPPALLILPALHALLLSLILESVFTRYMTDEDRRLEDIRNHPENYEYMNQKENFK